MFTKGSHQIRLKTDNRQVPELLVSSLMTSSALRRADRVLTVRYAVPLVARAGNMTLSTFFIWFAAFGITPFVMALEFGRPHLARGGFAFVGARAKAR